MDKRTFWATKSPLPQFETVTFSHPSFDAPIRLVANQFAPVILGGQTHTPAAMMIKPPEQTGAAQARLTANFPRQVVGREFKRQLKKVRAYPTPQPIAVEYALYLGETDAPKQTWQLYISDASGVQFNADVVQVVAQDDNPMRRAVAPVYDPNVWTGLELV